MLEDLHDRIQTKIADNILAGCLTAKSRCEQMDDGRLQLVLVMGTNATSHTVHEILQMVRLEGCRATPVTGPSNSTWIISVT